MNWIQTNISKCKRTNYNTNFNKFKFKKIHSFINNSFYLKKLYLKK